MTTPKAYGLTYQGSKNCIAEWVIDHLPHAKNFYDLFSGGGAITHAAFYDWAKSQKELTIISEYYMPSPDFIPIAAIKLPVQMQGGSGSVATEKLFIPAHQWDLYKRKSSLLF